MKQKIIHETKNEQTLDSFWKTACKMAVFVPCTKIVVFGLVFFSSVSILHINRTLQMNEYYSSL